MHGDSCPDPADLELRCGASHLRDGEAGRVLGHGSDSVGAAAFFPLADSPFIVSKCN